MTKLRCSPSANNNKAAQHDLLAAHSAPILKLERAKGFEPSTPTLARLCSTPELRPHPSVASDYHVAAELQGYRAKA